MSRRYRRPYRPSVPAVPNAPAETPVKAFDTQRFTPAREGLAPSLTYGVGEPLVQELHPCGTQDPFNTSWDNVADLTGYLGKLTANGQRFYSALSNCNTGRHEWSWGFQTWHSLAMAQTGWKSGASEVGTAHVDVANTFLSEHVEESTRYDVAGAFVDVATFLQGSPECMVDFCEEKRETRSVKILVDAFISCGVNADTAFLRGASIMSAILATQASGIAVTVEMACKMRMSLRGSPDRDGAYRVTLHRPGDTLDTSRLAYYLAHPAFLRNVFIQAACIAAGADGGTGDARTLQREEGPGVVYVPAMLLDNHPWGSPKANKALIEKIFSAAV